MTELLPEITRTSLRQSADLDFAGPTKEKNRMLAEAFLGQGKTIITRAELSKITGIPAARLGAPIKSLVDLTKIFGHIMGYRIETPDLENVAIIPTRTDFRERQRAFKQTPALPLFTKVTEDTRADLSRTLGAPLTLEVPKNAVSLILNSGDVHPESIKDLEYLLLLMEAAKTGSVLHPECVSAEIDRTRGDYRQQILLELTRKRSLENGFAILGAPVGLQQGKLGGAIFFLDPKERVRRILDTFGGSDQHPYFDNAIPFNTQTAQERLAALRGSIDSDLEKIIELTIEAQSNGRVPNIKEAMRVTSLTKEDIQELIRHLFQIRESAGLRLDIRNLEGSDAAISLTLLGKEINQKDLPQTNIDHYLKIDEEHTALIAPTISIDKEHSFTNRVTSNASLFGGEQSITYQTAKAFMEIRDEQGEGKPIKLTEVAERISCETRHLSRTIGRVTNFLAQIGIELQSRETKRQRVVYFVNLIPELGITTETEGDELLTQLRNEIREARAALERIQTEMVYQEGKRVKQTPRSRVATTAPPEPPTPHTLEQKPEPTRDPATGKAEAELAAIRDRSDRALGALRRRQRTISAIERSIAEAERKLGLIQEIQALKTELETLTAQKKAAMAEIKKLETEKKTRTAELEILDRNITSISLTVEQRNALQLKIKNEEAIGKLRRREKELSEVEMQLREKERALALLGEVEQLQQTVQELSQRVTQLRSIEAANTEVDQLKEQLTADQKIHEQTTAELRRELEAAQAKATQAQRQAQQTPVEVVSKAPAIQGVRFDEIHTTRGLHYSVGVRTEALVFSYGPFSKIGPVYLVNENGTAYRECKETLPALLPGEVYAARVENRQFVYFKIGQRLLTPINGKNGK